MSNRLTTVKKREIQTLKINVATHMLAYDTMDEKQAIEAWHKVPELAQAFEDMAYGSILKHMKDTLGIESFGKFCQKIDEFEFRDNVPYPSSRVYRLLDFAGYKEEGGVIETASHYREVKKVVGRDTAKIDEVYEELDSPKTAKDVKEQVQSVESKWLEDRKKEEILLEQFLELRPDLKVKAYEDSKTEIAVPTKEAWKKFFGVVSHCVHPDKGGEEYLQDILNNINAYMRNEIARDANRASKDLLNKEFSIFKRSN